MAQIPGKIPGTVAELERAISLLGNRGNGHELTPAMQQHIIETLGSYPEPKAAKAWKRVLKQRRLVLLEQTEPPLPSPTAELERPAWEGPLNASESQLIDAAWEKYKAAALHPIFDCLKRAYPSELPRAQGERLERLTRALREAAEPPISADDALAAVEAALKVLADRR